MKRKPRFDGRGRHHLLGFLGVLAVAATSVAVTKDGGVPDDAIHAGLPEGSDEIDFNRDVRPILVARCFACHGPDESTRERGLRLDIRDGAVQPVRTGRDPAIVPGDAHASLLIERITDELDPMPPSGERLTEDEIETLRRWIDAGAKYEGHWSWEPIEDPPVPAVAIDSTSVRTDIDRFIQARLDAEDLTPAGDAAPARQVRRLAYDLTGLPPDPATVIAFEDDPSDEHW
ncbi:MAG: c-type cytochrome domain-containing protein, partial [Planctomycetota bacterium]